MKAEIKIVRCDICGERKEGAEFRKNIFFKFSVCQTCLSKIFRSLTKGR